MESKPALTLIILAVLYLVGTTTFATVKPINGYINKCCANTTYPDLCKQSLSPYAKIIQTNPVQLCRIALILTLKRSHSVQLYFHKLRRFNGLKPPERAAIRDCIILGSISLHELGDAIQELKNFEPVKVREFKSHMQDLSLDVSAVLTDQDTCVDGFEGVGRIKSSVQAQITSVSHLTFIVLELIQNIHQKD